MRALLQAAAHLPAADIKVGDHPTFKAGFTFTYPTIEQSLQAVLQPSA